MGLRKGKSQKIMIQTIPFELQKKKRERGKKKRKGKRKGKEKGKGKRGKVNHESCMCA